MPNPRSSAWALIGVLVASMIFVPAAATPVSAAPRDRSVCQNDGFAHAAWNDELHPPPHVYVLRSSGPNAGHVERVDFWTYVGVVLRAEYSGSGPAGPVWQRIGAVSVKQYAWFYVMRWRGGKVSHTVTNPDSTTTTTIECYNVKDTTSDQLYKPEKWDTATGQWIPRNTPTADNLAAMADTWHMSLRKWKPKKSKTFLFLSGYRSGRKRPCGTDATGFRIYQKSLRDCVVKGLTLEEVQRKYYDPVYIVDTRGHDLLNDGETWYGDLAMLVESGGKVQARTYPGGPDRFGTASTDLFGIAWSELNGHGVGDVNGDERADLVMLTDGGTRIQLSISNGIDLQPPATTDVAGAARLFVADFDGDRLADAGLLRSTGAGTASLEVLRSLGNGSFGGPTAWWSGTLDLSSSSVYVAAGDVNGDGKADLIARDGAGSYSTALSRPSCTEFSAWGVCPAAAIGAVGLGDWTAAASTSWNLAEVKNVIGDFDRDGRDDILAVLKDGSGIKVMALRAQPAGTFAAPQQLWAGSVEFADLVPVALDINPDGMADVALVRPGTITWLRTIERTASPAAMTHMSSPLNDASITSSARAF